MYFLAVSCELVSYCSGHGACSGPNVCSCHSGFKGANCSEGMYHVRAPLIFVLLMSAHAIVVFN